MNILTLKVLSYVDILAVISYTQIVYDKLDWGLLLIDFNPLQTKRTPLYLNTQAVPRCKHFSSRL
jgi:hypothetical protein